MHQTPLQVHNTDRNNQHVRSTTVRPRLLASQIPGMSSKILSTSGWVSPSVVKATVARHGAMLARTWMLTFTSRQSAVGPDSLNRRSGWSWCADPDTQQPGLRLSSLHRTYRIHNCMSELLSHPITRTMPTGHRTALAASTPSYRIGLPTAEPEHAMATPLKPLDCGNRE